VYQSATRDDVLYINTDTRRAQIVDDGFRTVGQTEDGLPKPEFHMVGSDSNVVLTNGGPVVVYQDSTSHELLIAHQNAQGMWTHSTIAGGEEEFSGAYGFFASAVFAGEDVVISNWVIDQPDQKQWVEIHREKVMVE
jgi:hypothetical protein